MALGTPTTAAVAYSASGGTSVAPAYPTGLVADDVIVMFVGQKPTTANGGTVTTPTGWTLQDSLTAAGGYGTTTGADVGNTNLFVYTKNTVTGSETGTLSVTVGDNNVCWAFMIRVPVGNGTVSYGSADGQRTTTPTSPMSIALTNGTSATNFQAGDLALWAMCIPTDVTTPSQFSAESITATGATFGTAVEFNEPDSTTGNDIGGYSAYASVTSGSSTTAPTVTATLAGTLTNVRGPVVLLRVRETAPPTQGITQSARVDNTNTIYSATVTQFAPSQNLTQIARLDNANTFYSPTVSQNSPTQNLAPGLYTNANTFYAQTLSLLPYPLTQSERFNNLNVFYSPAIIRGAVNLSPIKVIEVNVFYSPTVIKGPANIAPSLFVNSNTIYSLHVTKDVYIINQHTRLDNVNTFYSAMVGRGAVNLAPTRYNNTNIFYSPYVTQDSYVLYQHTRFDNANTFYPINIIEGQNDLHQIERFNNVNTFYRATITGGAILAGGGGGEDSYSSKTPNPRGRAKGIGFANERAEQEAALIARFAKPNEVLSDSNIPAAKQVAKRLNAYLSDKGTADALQKQLERLQAQINVQASNDDNQNQLNADLKAAADEIQEFLQDEQDAIDLLMLNEENDDALLLMAIGF